MLAISGVERYRSFAVGAEALKEETIQNLSTNGTTKATATTNATGGIGKEFARLLVPSFHPAATRTPSTAAAAAAAPTSGPVSSTTDGDHDSLSISPSIFDDTYTTEESQGLLQTNDSAFVKATDPLAVFLDEMDDGYEDDINFGTNNSSSFGNYFAAI
jgi:hypothetical protein